MTTSGPEVGQVTDADVVEAAYGVLGELTEGTLSDSTVQQRAAEVCRATFGVVGSGPADPMWLLHTDVARQFLGAGGLTAAELTEWLAVQRHRETGETGTAPPPTEGDASAGPDTDAADEDALADVPDDVLAEAEAAALTVIDRYRHQQREGQTDDR
ncbi:flagellar hook-length control protein [Mycobacterium marinum]|uniref:flagellar hook-length control protein n=1 Tax=Mycobacterium marinum TaxID=1781 RepID=UPI003569A010